VTLRIPVHFELGVTYHGGSTVSAANQTIGYWSRAWSIAGNAGVGYDFTLFTRRFIVRPRVLAGCLLLSEATQLGRDERRRTEPVFTVGPGADLLVRFAGLLAGVDARAAVLPSRVAAPVGALYAVFGFER
jgi:hypothetical protein